MKKRTKKENPVVAEKPFVHPMTDPDGSWTGTPVEASFEVPPQDVDDL